MHSINSNRFEAMLDEKKEELFNACLRIEEFIQFCDQELKSGQFSNNEYVIFEKAISSKLTFDHKIISIINYIFDLGLQPLRVEKKAKSKSLIIRKLIS